MLDEKTKTMKKNIIFNAFYSEQYHVKVVGEKKKTQSSSYDMYCKCIIVSLCSAKLRNPFDEVALITNTRIPECYEKQLNDFGIKIIIAPFTWYTMPDKFIWRFAFYKLNALRFLLETTEYDNYLLLDTDTYHAKSLESFWDECRSNRVHFYSTRHSLEHKVRLTYIKEFRKIAPYIGCDIDDSIDQFGGEFIGCNRFMLKELVYALDKVYDAYASIAFDISTESGDELFLSVAASMLPVKEAGAYIERFWTQRFYLSSTKWHYDPVAIWHIPAEKKYGMQVVYNYYKKRKRFPTCDKSANIFNLPRRRKISRAFISTVIKKIFERLFTKK